MRLPNYLHDTLRELAQKEQVSINQFIVLAIAEKVSALKTVGYLEKWAERGNRAKFEAAMAKVPDVGPDVTILDCNEGGISEKCITR